jgi:hypothetical protein
MVSSPKIGAMGRVYPGVEGINLESRGRGESESCLYERVSKIIF